jgi:hypothetical protein
LITLLWSGNVDKWFGFLGSTNHGAVEIRLLNGLNRLTLRTFVFKLRSGAFLVTVNAICPVFTPIGVFANYPKAVTANLRAVKLTTHCWVGVCRGANLFSSYNEVGIR